MAGREGQLPHRDRDLRARRLRCGRCGADWAHTWLRCILCGEADHRRQGSLVPAESVPLEDLATVDLDVVALERGFRRPPARVVPCTVLDGEASSA